MNAPHLGLKVHYHPLRTELLAALKRCTSSNLASRWKTPSLNPLMADYEMNV